MTFRETLPLSLQQLTGLASPLSLKHCVPSNTPQHLTQGPSGAPPQPVASTSQGRHEAPSCKFPQNHTSPRLCHQTGKHLIAQRGNLCHLHQHGSTIGSHHLKGIEQFTLSSGLADNAHIPPGNSRQTQYLDRELEEFRGTIGIGTAGKGTGRCSTWARVWLSPAVGVWSQRQSTSKRE